MTLDEIVDLLGLDVEGLKDWESKHTVEFPPHDWLDVDLLYQLRAFYGVEMSDVERLDAIQGTIEDLGSRIDDMEAALDRALQEARRRDAGKGDSK